MTIVPIKGLPEEALDELTINSKGELIYRTLAVYDQSEGFDNRCGIVLNYQARGAIAGIIGEDLLVVLKITPPPGTEEHFRQEHKILLLIINRSTLAVTGLQELQENNKTLYWLLKSIGEVDTKSMDILPFRFYTSTEC